MILGRNYGIYLGRPGGSIVPGGGNETSGGVPAWVQIIIIK
jgi:hypothetical protein